jgi:zinc transport system permease protein
MKDEEPTTRGESSSLGGFQTPAYPIPEARRLARGRAPYDKSVMKKTLLTMFLMLVPASPSVLGEETHGTFQGFANGRLILSVDGEERAFDAANNIFHMGVRRQPADNSHFKRGVTRVLVRHDGNRATEVIELFRWYQYPGEWLQDSAGDFSEWWNAKVNPNGFLASRANVMALLSVLLVSVVCGVASSMVVSNRMAFFGDALAHCAFAGVGLGLLLYFLELLTGTEGVLGVMILFGILIGMLIAYVRKQTSLASDTVIGVFFAFAMGFGAVLLQYVGKKVRFGPEEFVFGSPWSVTGHELLFLVLLLIGMVALLVWLYNRQVFASFNPSLARSRNFPVEFGDYAFIVLLALIVNICLKVVGALLINALLILPAATAANVARNLRQFFWLSTALSLAAGLGGLALSTRLNQGPSGMIVLVGVAFFFLSMAAGRWVRGQRALVRPGF